jgi:hypothetical protein
MVLPHKHPGQAHIRTHVQWAHAVSFGVPRQAGLDDSVDVSSPGIDAPREAHLILAVDPAEIPDLAALPRRIRAALRDFHITLDLPQGEHDEITDSLIDGLFLDGEPVCLVKLKPRT